MKILSRGQLMEVIDKNGVETVLLDSKKGKKIFNTIIYKKATDTFYKLTWGEIKDDSGKPHIWFKEDTQKVKANPDGVWMTKEEMTEYKESLRSESDDNYLNRLPLTNIEHETVEADRFYPIKPRKGQSLEMARRAAIELKKGKSVLFLSTEDNFNQILSGIMKVLIGESYVKLEDNKANFDDLKKINEAIKLVTSGKLTIKTNYLLDSNYVKESMYEVSNSKHGLDLVIIDHLKLNIGNSTLNNSENIEQVFSYVDKLARDLSCRVTVSTELNTH